MTKFVRDPLFHFLIAGGLMYAVSTMFFGTAPPDQGQIVVSAAQQQHFADLFSLTWQRPANDQELSNLVAEHIKEEVYYRQALALGLDKNDTIVRRRLRQKLEFVQQDLVMSPPSDEALGQYYSENKEKYHAPRLLSYQQILVSKQRLMADTEVIEQVQSKLKLILKQGAPAKSLSLSSLLPSSMKFENQTTVANTFGQEFLEQLSGIEKSVWAGPVYSTFGTHLVNVSLDQAAHPIELIEAMEQVRADYLTNQREIAAENFYQSLRSQYQVEIESRK